MEGKKVDKKKKIKIDVWKVGKSKKNNREHAATIQDSEYDPIPAFARETDQKPPKKQSKVKTFKPIIVTTISAIAIGSILGVIMLRMFVGIDSDLAENNNLPAATIDTEDEDSNTENGPSASEEMDAYVLQGGVFSDKANAEEWVSKYEQAGLPSFIWEKEENYFLLVGIANTKEQAEQFADEIKEYEFDIYVKEWTTNEGAANLTNEEVDWIQSFHENWQNALQSLENDQSFTVDNWEALIENYPEETENLAALKETLSSYQESIQAQAEGFEAQHILLHLWQQYNNVIN